MKKLFTIPTEIEVLFAVDKDGLPTSKAIGVRIVASQEVKGRIWRLVTNDHLNPGAVEYSGGSPTIMTLIANRPYPWQLAANMAITFASIATIDWTDLVDGTNCFELAGNDRVKVPSDFTPDTQMIAELQERYLRWKLGRAIENAFDELRGVGINTSEPEAWKNAANLAQLRCEFAGEFMTMLSGLTQIVRAFNDKMKELQARREKVSAELAQQRRIFEQMLPTEKLGTLYDSLAGIQRQINDEIAIRRSEFDANSAEWCKIRDEVMPQILTLSPIKK